MRYYKITYNCAKCKRPCCEDPTAEANEIIYAKNTRDALAQFRAYKSCFHQKATRIELYDERNPVDSQPREVVE